MSNVIAQVFEHWMKNFLDKYLVFYPNQFGFVRDGGCSKAIFAFSRIVNFSLMIEAMFLFVH